MTAPDEPRAGRAAATLALTLPVTVGVAWAVATLAPARQVPTRTEPPPQVALGGAPARTATVAPARTATVAPARTASAAGTRPAWMAPVPAVTPAPPGDPGPAVGGPPGVEVGLRLVAVRLVAVRLEGGWKDRRAELVHEKSGQRALHAIGDLLPGDAVLVGIADGSVELMVADRELVRLRVAGPPEKLHDFHLATGEGGVLAPHREGGEVRMKIVVEDEGTTTERWRVQRALEQTRSADPAEVQAAIDLLVEAGDPAIELLVGYVGSSARVARGTYDFPSGGRARAPRTVGHVVIAVLEAITGQAFGDPMREGMTPWEQQQIAKSWTRWWWGSE